MAFTSEAIVFKQDFQSLFDVDFYTDANGLFNDLVQTDSSSLSVQNHSAKPTTETSNSSKPEESQAEQPENTSQVDICAEAFRLTFEAEDSNDVDQLDQLLNSSLMAHAAEEVLDINHDITFGDKFDCIKENQPTEENNNVVAQKDMMRTVTSSTENSSLESCQKIVPYSVEATSTDIIAKSDPISVPTDKATTESSSYLKDMSKHTVQTSPPIIKTTNVLKENKQQSSSLDLSAITANTNNSVPDYASTSSTTSCSMVTPSGISRSGFMQELNKSPEYCSPLSERSPSNSSMNKLPVSCSPVYSQMNETVPDFSGSYVSAILQEQATSALSGLVCSNSQPLPKRKRKNSSTSLDDSASSVNTSTGSISSRVSNQCQWTCKGVTDDPTKNPQVPYLELCAGALLSSNDPKGLLLTDMYTWVTDRFPFYANTNFSWKNSIRHALCVNECFIKLGQAPVGRGFYWAIHPACLEDFKRGDFNRRQVRKRIQEYVEDDNEPPRKRSRKCNGNSNQSVSSTSNKPSAMMGAQSPHVPMLQQSPSCQYYNPAAVQYQYPSSTVQYPSSTLQNTSSTTKKVSSTVQPSSTTVPHPSYQQQSPSFQQMSSTPVRQQCKQQSNNQHQAYTDMFYSPGYCPSNQFSTSPLQAYQKNQVPISPVSNQYTAASYPSGYNQSVEYNASYYTSPQWNNSSQNCQYGSNVWSQEYSTGYPSMMQANNSNNSASSWSYYCPPSVQ